MIKMHNGIFQLCSISSFSSFIIRAALMAFLSFQTLISLVTPVWAQLEVPVVYTLTQASRPIEGVLIGGTLCDAEGLSIKDANATFSRIVNYEKIDKVEELTPIGGKKVLMKIVLKDGNRFQAYADLHETEPFIILRDEHPEGASGTPKIRTFNKSNFKGLYLLEFEAEPEGEVSEEEILKQVEELADAIKKDDLDRAIDLHNKIGDFLEAWQDEVIKEEDGK